MNRTIKASEIKPGMTIRWTHSGLTQECTVGSIVYRYSNGAVDITTPEDAAACVRCVYPVTVLSEPAPVQPEEPTAFGARVRVRDGRFVRLEGEGFLFRLWYEKGSGDRWAWDDLCEMGPVTVIDADPSWTAPEAPVVPERIEEWPENDEHLKVYRWRCKTGDVWQWNAHEDKWHCNGGRTGKLLGRFTSPDYAPFTREARVTDA